jgi:hypothetical protein
MQNQQTRATTALKLLQAAIDDDDQNCFDFLCDVIERDRLYLCFQSDDGEPIRNLAEFVADLGVEPEPRQVDRISANAANFDHGDGVRFTPRLTRAERYRQRQNENHQRKART